MFDVKCKLDNEFYTVYDIQYGKKDGYPRFLIYRNGAWVKIKAKHFVPLNDAKKWWVEFD